MSSIVEIKFEEANLTNTPERLLCIKILVNPQPSKSGKSTVIASTHGNQATTLQYKGRVVKVGLNAFAVL